MPQLILSADPAFVALALEEFRRDSLNGRPLAELAPGVWLVDSDEGFWGVAATWIDGPPIFVRHICPVDLAIPLVATPRDMARLSDAAVAEYSGLLDKEVSFSVQTRVLPDLPYKPFDINRAVAAALSAAASSPLDVRQPFQIISIVCVEGNGLAALPRRSADRPAAGEHGYMALLGMSLASHNISDWAGGVRRFRREKEQISRSEFKLLEALEAFHIRLPAGGVSLDLGAAPGGWTRVLRQRGQYVTAVDPADLHPRLDTDRAVRHKRMTAGAYLREGPDNFDFLANDMRMEPMASARLMNEFAVFLYPHADVVMTFKLGRPSAEGLLPARLERAIATLQERYAILHVRQLFHNRREVTIHMKPEQPLRT